MQIVAVDIVGPISPSTTGNAYMFCTARFKTFDPLPSRSTDFKTGQLILSHTWLFTNCECERFVGSFWPLAMKWNCTLERRNLIWHLFFPRSSPPLIR